MTEQTDNVTADAPDTLAVARSLMARWAWAEAFNAARLADVAPGRAEANRLDIVAEAAWWLGRLDDCIEAREQAYPRYEAVGDRLRAGQCAVRLWEHHQFKAHPAIAGAWLRRARHALEADTESIEFGNLELREAELAHGSGDLAGATTLARDALRLGQQLSSADLEAEALQTIGRVLIDAGRLADGLGHLDEAMLSAVEGRLGPYTTGKVYCSLISACEELGDLRRAAEWTDATLRWSENHPLAMWPAICRLHHAALLQLRGDWGAAEREARQACLELDGFHVPNVAAGYIEIGEIRRRLGDLDGAEEAFARAEELCGQQSAGLALVRLAQRRVDAATAIITRMLAEHTWNQLARGKLLPARVQIAVAAGDLDTAAAAVNELETHRHRLQEPAPVGRGTVVTRAAPARPGRRQRGVRDAAPGPSALAAARGSLRGRDSPPAARPSVPRLRRRGRCHPIVRQRGRHLRSARSLPRRRSHSRPHVALVAAGRTHRTRGRGPRPRRIGTDQQRDRRHPSPQRTDNRSPPLEHLHQGWRDLAYRRRRLRLRTRPRPARSGDRMIARADGAPPNLPPTNQKISNENGCPDEPAKPRGSQRGRATQPRWLVDRKGESASAHTPPFREHRMPGPGAHTTLFDGVTRRDITGRRVIERKFWRTEVLRQPGEACCPPRSLRPSARIPA